MKYTKKCEANRGLVGAGVGTFVGGFPIGTAVGMVAGNATCPTKKKGVISRVVGSAKSAITPSTYVK